MTKKDAREGASIGAVPVGVTLPLTFHVPLVRCL
jgi:hypothetical protein